MSKGITPTRILEAAHSNPQGFLYIDFDKPRDTKNSANLYHDVKIVMPDGTKKKLGISWTNIALAGGIKKPEERKYDPSVVFRKSSGELGKALYLVYKEYERQIESGKANGSIKLKKGKDVVRTILQEDLEDGTKLDDPMIRMKLPFNRDTGKPKFRVVQIEAGADGKLKQVNVNVTKENIHNIIRSRSITAGYATFDSLVYSAFGISMPANVELLIIKPPEDDIPEVEDLLDDDMMRAMAIKKNEYEETEETVTESKEDNEKTTGNNTEDQLKELEALANSAQNVDENDDAEHDDEQELA